MTMNQNDLYLIKLKAAKLPSSTIATKLGMSTVEVERHWKRIQEEVENAALNGHTNLCNQYTVLCHQYQLLGESLKIISMALANEMTEEDLKKVVTKDAIDQNGFLDVDRVIKNLRRSCIILRPFTPIDPAESLKETNQRIQEGN